MFLIFDTETTGLPLNHNAPVEDLDNWPRLVQISWQLHQSDGRLAEAKNFIIKPEGFTIPYNAEKVHGISTQRALTEGVDLKWALQEFNNALALAQYLIGHNIGFDINVLCAEFLRIKTDTQLNNKKIIDTQVSAVDFCAIPGGKGGKYKYPKLSELHHKLFGIDFKEAHNAVADVEATTRCFFRLMQLGIVQVPDISVDDHLMQYLHDIAPQILQTVKPAGITTSTASTSDKPKLQNAEKEQPIKPPYHVSSTKPGFVHLHCHSQFSLHPSSTSSVSALVAMAKQFNMPALALTDHGNMYGAFLFANEAHRAGIKPIIGCEFYLCQDRFDKKNKDNGYHQVLLAKNKKGYQNLVKLSSLSFIEGFYYVPRIDRKLLTAYKNDLIATTGSLSAEIPSLILNQGESKAEEAFLWWKDLFGDDFYVEINRHGLEEEEYVNKILLDWCAKYHVKYFAANNTYYNTRKESETHDILQCIIDGELKNTPIGKGRGYRFGFPNNQYYFRSAEEMYELFYDLPEAIYATLEIADKIESYHLKRDVLLPRFDIPAGFKDENEYLRYLTYEGAKKRYPEISPEIQSRIDFELHTITSSGYAGYFLIVQDLISKVRGMGVWVGPGRGSAAGSAVAYCIGITNIDPIRYNLLFERFLNPERVSMPDIDIDFDDRGRGKVMHYVLEKYGSNKVAQIITYGTMAAKSAIRNTARVLNLPLDETDRLAKAFPDFLATHPYFEKSPLRILITQPEKLQEARSTMTPQEYRIAEDFRKISEENSLQGEILRQAALLEGALRTTGVHACGVIISPEDITDYVPVKSVDNSEISLVTQYDNDVVESAGLLKMDFLGLNTLSIINDVLEIIKARHGITINPDEIPLDDKKTYQLFQRGETVGIFQYESPGMQKYLKSLKPDKFDDLIAMNALYRPGPMAYIDTFIDRKHGRSPIEYDLPAMEDILKETYGVTVYQEQVMLLSQKLAGFSQGKADELRKAMGKKIRSKLDELKPLFISGCAQNGHDVTIAEKIWKDWEAFAEYAFNKSHATCYAVLAFQTAYLKAHYPAEFMAAVLSNNMDNIKEVSFFMEECKRMGLKVLGPDINESQYRFTVNKNGEVRFGLGAIKGVGEGAVECIVTEREKNGPYTSFFDLTSRVDLRQVNKKTLEALVLAGAFDCFKELHRAQYFAEENMSNLIEKAIRYGNMIQDKKRSTQISLFGESIHVTAALPRIPECEEWTLTEKLNKEKEVVGIYLSEHPLDAFKLTINYCCNATMADLKRIEDLRGMELRLAGMVVDFSHNTSKNGTPYGTLTLEDYSDKQRFFLFGNDYVNFRKYFNKGDFLYVKGRVQPRREKKQENGTSQYEKTQPEQFEFKVLYIDLLSEVIHKEFRSAIFRIPFHEVTDELVNELTLLVQQHPGNFDVYVQLIDTSEKQEVTLHAPRFRIALNNKLHEQISRFPCVELVLN